MTDAKRDELARWVRQVALTPIQLDQMTLAQTVELATAHYKKPHPEFYFGHPPAILALTQALLEEEPQYLLDNVGYANLSAYYLAIEAAKHRALIPNHYTRFQKILTQVATLHLQQQLKKTRERSP